MNCEGNLTDMTPSRIQFSVITKLICLRSEDLDCVALFFIKHGAEVCKKFYLQFFLNREAACLSRKCVNVLLIHMVMMKRQATYEKFLKMGRVPYDKKKLGNGAMALKC